MAPRWTNTEQDAYLESCYSKYVHLQHQGSRMLWKWFWEGLKADWIARFGWTAQDDIDEKGAPCLDRVSICTFMKSKEFT